MQMASDKRQLSRLPCQIAITERARSASLGEIENISLDGIFVATTRPLPDGAVIPVAFKLGDDGAEIRADVEVVHKTAQGMGLKFISLVPRDARRLRRYVSDLNSTVTQHESAARMRDSVARSAAPVVGSAQILKLLEGSFDSPLVVIPDQRSIREQARLTKVHDGEVRMRCTGICSLTVGETVLVLYTHQFVSYSFQTVVLSVSDHDLCLTLPSAIHYSERRSRGRTSTSDRTTFSLPLPWRNGQRISWPVSELSEGGLSFRADPKEVFFWPGTTLPGAEIQDESGQRALDQAIVKHLTAARDDDGTEWLRVGVAFGVERHAAATSHETAGEEERPVSGHLQAIAGWLRRLPHAVMYLYHSRLRRRSLSTDGSASTVVRFNNSSNKQVVGLLNSTFDSTRAVRSPLVIIVPGFAARKEVSSALALTVTDNFRRMQRDVAVLRYDGTNNLGESYKSPGCEAEGKHLLKFTIQDGVDDLLGAIAWAKNNRFVDPTDIVVISLSMSAIAVRRALTLPEAKSVTRWISVMGPADAVHSIANAMGNSDPYANFLNGIPNGIVTLFGCLVDGDHYCAETHNMRVGTLDDARREMAQISADCTWIVGKHDAFIDPVRVQDIMTVKAPGKRDIITVNAGHLPRTSEQALSQFQLITRLVWRHLFGRDIVATVPSRGWLAAHAEAEWTRVRHARPQNEQDYWRSYLLGDGGTIGFDIWTVTPEYRQLIEDQVRLASPEGQRFLDLGAGTGNVSGHAAKHHRPREMIAIDLVPEALERLKLKMGDCSIRTVATSIDGTPVVAMRRWLHGEIVNLSSLAHRFPIRHAAALEAIATNCTERLHALLRGVPIDIAFALKEANLPPSLEPLLRDVHLMARQINKRISLAEACASATPDFAEVLRGPQGLPLEDCSVDSIVCSLVLSYLKYPEDALAEMHRILAPGGRLVISTMRPDSEASATYMNTLKFLETAPEAALPAGYSRDALIEAARHFLDNACALVRMEEEGIFHFWDGEELGYMAARAGFENVTQHLSFGDPAQAVIVQCKKQ